ncbi:unnamed protein product [Echinostoma caproni]|uniref:Uncharacterized protein n=1 Tax=Echinostoma caproni TaxID=27848 RepID=A0A3P8IF92_9TREM|nr:unnamed protein product [Echinostoma caproni]
MASLNRARSGADLILETALSSCEDSGIDLLSGGRLSGLDYTDDIGLLNEDPSVVTVGQYIYAVGGYDSCSQLRTVERYDPERNVWEYRASMLHPRSALSAAVLDNEIWVFDGIDFQEKVSCSAEPSSGSFWTGQTMSTGDSFVMIADESCAG